MHAEAPLESSPVRTHHVQQGLAAIESQGQQQQAVVAASADCSTAAIVDDALEVVAATDIAVQVVGTAGAAAAAAAAAVADIAVAEEVAGDASRDLEAVAQKAAAANVDRPCRSLWLDLPAAKTPVGSNVATHD